ncbi:SDR family oxidoreductase [Rhodovastum atsumiense]|uniref:SDR family oxidoreductase n=1 Tax=Rhodovastum atsumiense TaxID=504468 RepID=A0A5M6J3U1_9PROT|nr:SDR family oxidoreductase [Rhodovastum atsumiense]KAA5614325.1 SDR family oxidoreductase [Rhodovastum atsumiense]CAH2604792.1 SDR family oxidoreductase [Rhodovastum atsumiense]
MTDRFLLIFGLGYTGAAIARHAVASGWRVAGASRDPDGIAAPAGVEVVGFDRAAEALVEATHLVATAPPAETGDPVLAAHEAAIAAAPRLAWAGYLSTTGVFGDRNGDWVDEDTPPAPASERTRRRVEAERHWATLAGRIAVDVFRVGGIYGPGRSAIEEVRAGTARRILRPGHQFGRIHRDDIARAVVAAAGQERGEGLRYLNLVDDVPAESALVLEEAARLLGVDAPPAIAFEQAHAAMSPMARSFWAENRKVSSVRTKAALGLEWLYPSYREGLAAILRGPDGKAESV